MKHNNIPVGCVPPAWQPYVFRWQGVGYVQRGYGMSRVPLPCDLSHDACDVTYPRPPPPPPVDRQLWKHYLPATTVAGGKNNNFCLTIQEIRWYLVAQSLRSRTTELLCMVSFFTNNWPPPKKKVIWQIRVHTCYLTPSQKKINWDLNLINLSSYTVSAILRAGNRWVTCWYSVTIIWVTILISVCY